MLYHQIHQSSMLDREVLVQNCVCAVLHMECFTVVIGEEESNKKVLQGGTRYDS